MTEQVSPMLDFLCVGAPRSGTTTLHKILSLHKRICLPPSKELPIFHRPDFSSKLWRKFCNVHLSHRKGLRGKVTPQYWTEGYLPMKLKVWFPKIKILILLRDPVNRFVSAYRIRWIRGWEGRTFKEFLNDALDPSALDWARKSSFLREGGDHAPFIAAAGEYHRILLNWFNTFPKNQILIVIFEEMITQPVLVFEHIFRFLGVAPLKVSSLPRENIPSYSWTLGTISRVCLSFHNRLGKLGEKLIFNSRCYAKVVMQSSINLQVRKEPTLPDADDLERLRSFYREDKDKLRSLLKRPIPWEDDK